jgi:hypothetical protein
LWGGGLDRIQNLLGDLHIDTVDWHRATHIVSMVHFMEEVAQSIAGLGKSGLVDLAPVTVERGEG